MTPMSAEATVVRNYIDWMISLPWFNKSRYPNDLIEAEKFSTKTITVWKNPRNAFSNTWRFRPW
jgi:ATP-dependent Lon protease